MALHSKPDQQLISSPCVQAMLSPGQEACSRPELWALFQQLLAFILGVRPRPRACGAWQRACIASVSSNGAADL